MNYFLYKKNTLFCHIEKNSCESIRYLILKEENEEKSSKYLGLKN
jgi:hypothetical protein